MPPPPPPPPPPLPSLLSTPINVTVYVIRGGGGDATTCAVPPRSTQNRRGASEGARERVGSVRSSFPDSGKSCRVGSSPVRGSFCLLRGVGRSTKRALVRPPSPTRTPTRPTVVGTVKLGRRISPFSPVFYCTIELRKKHLICPTWRVHEIRRNC